MGIALLYFHFEKMRKNYGRLIIQISKYAWHYLPSWDGNSVRPTNRFSDWNDWKGNVSTDSKPWSLPLL
jgi:hypothetical protein